MTILLWTLAACLVTSVAIGLDTICRLERMTRAWKLAEALRAAEEAAKTAAFAGWQRAIDALGRAEQQVGVPQMIPVSMALARAIMGDLQPDPTARRQAETKGRN